MLQYSCICSSGTARCPCCLVASCSRLAFRSKPHTIWTVCVYKLISTSTKQTKDMTTPLTEHQFQYHQIDYLNRPWVHSAAAFWHQITLTLAPSGPMKVYVHDADSYTGRAVFAALQVGVIWQSCRSGAVTSEPHRLTAPCFVTGSRCRGSE